MDLGMNIKDVVNTTRKKSLCTGDIMGGRRKSIAEVAGAIRTGVRVNSITKDTATNSEFWWILPSMHASLNFRLNPN